MIRNRAEGRKISVNNHSQAMISFQGISLGVSSIVQGAQPFVEGRLLGDRPERRRHPHFWASSDVVCNDLNTAFGTETLEIARYASRVFQNAAFDFYRVLISGSGTGPMNFGIQIPLSYDSLVIDTFMGSYPFPQSSDLHGTLDAAARASASVTLPAGLPASLIGNTYHLAAISNLPGQLFPRYSSVAVPMTITP
jgi:hypothetical protein